MECAQNEQKKKWQRCVKTQGIYPRGLLLLKPSVVSDSEFLDTWIQSSRSSLLCCIFKVRTAACGVMPARLGNVDSYLCGPSCVSWMIQSCWGKDLWWKIAPPFETAQPSFLLSFFVWFLFLDQTIRRDSRCGNRIQLLVRQEEQEQRQNSNIHGRRLKTTYIIPIPGGPTSSALWGHLCSCAHLQILIKNQIKL